MRSFEARVRTYKDRRARLGFSFRGACEVPITPFKDLLVRNDGKKRSQVWHDVFEATHPTPTDYPHLLMES